MVKEEKIESLLHLGISLILNLLLFTLLSLYLSVKVNGYNPTPLEVYLQETPQVEEVTFTKGSEQTPQKPKEGQALVRKGLDKGETSPLKVERKVGDVQVPAGIPKEEPSLLREIEQRIKGKEREVEREGTKAGELGDMVAILSPEGLGLSGSGRATLHTPPIPRIVSDEPLSPIKVRIWVEPSGFVSKAQIVQKSGSPQVDQKMLEFVKGIRFEPIKENVVQTGVITFRFKGG
ncbi:MAG: energy transducer TonB [Aquificaceae bacterium]|nr:energy transducer TonB [Aquificaceae bacterium]MDW8293870.1 energy transducer TonB [Aquificaceae bacterium]